MTDPKKYDETFDIVTAMAKTKMLMNSHKGQIEDVDLTNLIQMGKREFEELEEAVKDGDYIKIIEEAADVVNFAVASVHNAVQKYRTRK